jgi:biotin carboxyl carrier protein
MTYEVELDGHTALIDVAPHPDGGWWVSIDAAPRRHWTGRQLGAAEWILEAEAVQHRVGVHVEGDRVAVQLSGQGLIGSIVDPRDKALAAAIGGGEGVVSTPMPGLVVRIPVEAGQEVVEGQVLVVVEAMKMENEYKSPVAGTVTTVHVASGDSVDAGAVLITVEPA